jgi:hypothetical protein
VYPRTSCRPSRMTSSTERDARPGGGAMMDCVAQ